MDLLPCLRASYRHVRGEGAFKPRRPAHAPVAATGPAAANVHPSWHGFFAKEVAKPYFSKLQAFVEGERQA